MTSNMPRTAIIFGGLLILLGVAGYAIGLLGDYASWTSLIPAFPGVLILLAGFVGMQGESVRKHAMHFAAVIALLGALATTGGFMRAINPETFNIVSFLSVLGMLVLCAGFLVLCIKSFIAARKAREATAATPAS